MTSWYSVWLVNMDSGYGAQVPLASRANPMCKSNPGWLMAGGNAAWGGNCLALVVTAHGASSGAGRGVIIQEYNHIANRTKVALGFL